MTSNSEFGLKTSALDVAKTFSERIKGRNVLVTGVSPNGVGEGTAIAFASQHPATLVLASRTQSKIDDVVSKIHAQYPKIHVETVLLDLSSQNSVRQAADSIKKLVNKLDILVNNAGVVVQNRQWTPEHIELQFGANHVGPFLLTNLLLTLLHEAAKSSAPGTTRIINVSSAGHRLSPIRFHDYNFEGHPIPPEEQPFSPLPEAFTKADNTGYPGFLAYGQAKTANILFTLYLQQHLQAAGIASYSLHPGNVSTDLSRNLDEEGSDAIQRTGSYWKTPDEGAATTLVAALDPALNNPGGLYLDNCQFAQVAPHAEDKRAAEKLWQLSEKLVHSEFPLESRL